jgi:hypothetical protein
MTRTVLTKGGKPRALTPENCTISFGPWESGEWESMDWASARFDPGLSPYTGLASPHIRVLDKDGEAHRIRGKRFTIAGLLP